MDSVGGSPVSRDQHQVQWAAYKYHSASGFEDPRYVVTAQMQDSREETHTGNSPSKSAPQHKPITDINSAFSPIQEKKLERAQNYHWSKRKRSAHGYSSQVFFICQES